MEPELVADLAGRFGETFEDKYTDQQWKEAYQVEEITDNINALYFMMWGETIVTFKLAEKQARVNFICLLHFSNSDIEPQPVPHSWYPSTERKSENAKKNYNKDEEPTNDWDLCDILAAQEFRRGIEPKQIEMKQRKWPKGVLQFTSQAMDQDKPEVVVIEDPRISTTPAAGGEGVIQEERVMEVMETEREKQPEVKKFTEQIKKMKEKIEMLEKEKIWKSGYPIGKTAGKCKCRRGRDQ
uniref:Uncharacterized protein n=1 Tax=Romanomermis culicivorax TaxID=13658 RepID=A0A915HZF9_ROMCU